MKLTPVEVLEHLGFTVPIDGVDINPHDTFLHVATLKALGATMNIMAVPSDTLEGIRHGVVGLAGGYRGREEKLPLDRDSLFDLRGTMAALLNVYYRRQSPELDAQLAASDGSELPPPQPTK